MWEPKFSWNIYFPFSYSISVYLGIALPGWQNMGTNLLLWLLIEPKVMWRLCRHSLPAVGMPLSFTQQALSDLMSGWAWGYWANGSNGRGDKTWLCPEETIFCWSWQSSCKESIIIQWKSIVLMEYKKSCKAQREEEITLPGKVSWQKGLLSSISMDWL